MRRAQTIALCFALVLLCLMAGCSLSTLEAPWRVVEPAKPSPSPTPSACQPTTATLPAADACTTGGAQVGTKERGLSTWYGQRHHGRPTASGEVYNRFAFTAAHPSLPFGTRIRVQNLCNGQEVVVRVTDRCPGVEGRILDLSEVAGNAIGIRTCGVGRVEIEVVDPSTPVPETIAQVEPVQKKHTTRKTSSVTSRHKKSRPLQAVKGPRRKAAPSAKVRLQEISSADSK